MANFTPGPWRLEQTHALWGEVRAGYGFSNKMIADCVSGDDAELITQAPAMYEALVMVHKACGPSEIWNGETQKFLEAIEKILSELDENFDPQAPMKELSGVKE